MERFIPYGKLSPKKKRELAKRRRKTWGALNPVTRKPENPKAYKRKSRRNDDFDSAGGFFYLLPRKSVELYTLIIYNKSVFNTEVLW